jgi:hypothetical protein
MGLGDFAAGVEGRGVVIDEEVGATDGAAAFALGGDWRGADLAAN